MNESTASSTFQNRGVRPYRVEHRRNEADNYQTNLNSIYDRSIDKERRIKASQSTSIEEAPELALIKLIITEIENGRPGPLAKYLDQLPLNDIDLQASDDLLVMLLMEAWTYGQAIIVPTILDAWRKVYPKEERMPFYIYLTMLPKLTTEALNFIYVKGLSSRGVTYFGIMTDLINNHNFETIMACKRLTDAYGSMGYTMLKNLYDIAMEERNAPASNYLASKIVSIAPYQDIPPWVLDFRTYSAGVITADEELPTYEETEFLPSDIEIELPSDNILIEMYDSGEVEHNMSRSEFISAIEKMNTANKMNTFRPILQRMVYRYRQNDTNLFRLYGPTILSTYPTLNELRYGGLRMFLSIEHPEQDLEQLVEKEDWFTGSCDFCLLQIRRRWHAVRRPIATGGWYGCYCSWTCIRKSMAEPNRFDAIPDDDILTRLMVDEMETQISTIGIQDRRNNGNIVSLTGYEDIEL